MAENFAPPPSLQPQLPMAEAPRPWWKKPWLYAVFFLIFAAAAGAVFFWGRSRQVVPAPPSASPDPLSLSEAGSLPASTPVPGGLELNVPSSSFQPPAGKEERLAIDIKYARSPQFTLTVGTIVKTNEDPTIDLFVPEVGAPYSLLQVLDAKGAVITEDRFTVVTETNVEFFGDAPQQPITDFLPGSSNRFVVAVPHDRIPAKVAVRSAGGALLSEQSFTFTSLPSFTPQPTASPVSWLERMKSWFLPGETARAQGGGDITLVVINEVGAAPYVDAVAASARQVTAIQPWLTFSGNVRVVPIFNNAGLGCEAVRAGPKTTYPRCPDSGRIISIVAQQVPTWDGIIVATNIDCQCGMVAGGMLPILAVGTGADGELLLHELGHALGKMTDEYLYQWGVTSGVPGPNCYDDQNSCTATATKFPGAVCSLGCNSITSWRPSTRIMHNTYNPLDFGPVEECMMGKKLAAIAGGTYPCPDDDSDDGDSPPRPNDFYGWHR